MTTIFRDHELQIGDLEIALHNYRQAYMSMRAHPNYGYSWSRECPELKEMQAIYKDVKEKREKVQAIAAQLGKLDIELIKLA